MIIFDEAGMLILEGTAKFAASITTVCVYASLQLPIMAIATDTSGSWVTLSNSAGVTGGPKFRKIKLDVEIVTVVQTGDKVD